MKTVSLIASVSRKAGGLFESVRRLHQSLAAIPEVEVTALGLEDEYTREDVPKWLPLPVQTFQMQGPAQFGYAPKLRNRVLSMEIDLLHNHGLWMYPSIVTTAWHKATRRPYMISPHGMLDPWALRNSAWKKRLALSLFENQHLREAGCIRALCPSEADSIRALDLRVPVCVVPNGIDLPELQNAECEMQNPPWEGHIESGRKVLLYLGRIHPKKGLVNLLKAWARVNAERGMRNAEWVLAIAGWDQGGHEAELKQLATELGIPWHDIRHSLPSPPRSGTTLLRGGEKVSEGRMRCGLQGSGEVSIPSAILHPQSSLLFLGPQFDDAKAVCYANCSAFILPSFSEGLPMVVLEAWAYAKPVLMTPECNLPEGFEANAAIRIETNVDSIATGLRQMVALSESSSPLRLDRGESDATLAHRMGEGLGVRVSGEVSKAVIHSALGALGANGRQLVAAKFAWRQIACEMWLLYDWLLGGGTKPGSVA